MRRLLAFAWLAACNPLLDLDETVEVASDQDRDQIHDFADNCPDAHNPEQVDSDGDGAGDDCDSCPEHLPTNDLDGDGIDDACDELVHDEDGDGIDDATDPCPVVAGTLGDPDVDGDGVANACDLGGGGPMSTASAVALFESFRPPSTEWLSRTDDGWHETQDAVAPTTIASSGYAVWERRSTVLLQRNWHLEAGLALPNDLGANDEVGIAVLRNADSSDVTCFVGCDAGACRISIAAHLSGPTPIPIRGTVELAGMTQLRIRLTAAVMVDDNVPPTYSTDLRCEILGVDAVSATNNGRHFVWPALIANRPAELTYVMAVQDAL